MKKLLVVVDMQNDFVNGALGTKEAEAIVPAVVAKVRAAMEDGTFIVLTRDTHYEHYMDTAEGKKLPVPHCIQGTHGWHIIDCIQEQVRNYSRGMFMNKETFGSTALCDFIQSKKPDEIELVGLCTDICVISNALLAKAAWPEAEVSVDASCCAGVTPESHNNALAAMKMCQIVIKE